MNSMTEIKRCFEAILRIRYGYIGKMDDAWDYLRLLPHTPYMIDFDNNTQQYLIKFLHVEDATMFKLKFGNLF